MIADQVVGTDSFQSGRYPIVQRNGEKAVVMSAAILYAIRLITMCPNVSRELLRLVVRSRTAGDFSGASYSCETVVVQLDDTQVAKHPERRETMGRELGACDDPDGGISKERLYKACRSVLTEEAHAKFPSRVMEPVGRGIAWLGPEKRLARR